MSKVETKIVVDVLALNLPQEIVDEISQHYEANNDTYHRYYPDPGWTYIKPEIKSEINAALLKEGVQFPAEGKDILLHFSW